MPDAGSQAGGGHGNLEFLSIKEHDTKRVDVDNQSTLATGVETDLATQTANTGNDMWLAHAQVGVGEVASVSTVTIRLYVNGVVEEEFTKVFATGFSRSPIDFVTTAVKVATGQIIKITVDSTGSSSIKYDSKLLLWEEDSGETPEI